MRTSSKRIISHILAWTMVLTTFLGSLPPLGVFAQGGKSWMHLQSTAENGNGHFDASSAAFALSAKEDIQGADLSAALKIKSAPADTRLRLVTKYVDENNWAFIGYDNSSKWFYQYKKEGTSDWGTISGLQELSQEDELVVTTSSTEEAFTLQVENKSAGNTSSATLNASAGDKEAAFILVTNGTGKIGFGGGTYGTAFTSLYFADVTASGEGVTEFALLNGKGNLQQIQEGGEGETPGTQEPDPEEPTPDTPQTGQGRAWWKITSGSGNGFGHAYGDPNTNAPALLLDQDRTTSDAGTLSMVVKPSDNWGIFYNYVDNDNWLYVGWDGTSHWYYEYKLNGTSAYSKFGSFPDPVVGQEVAVTLSVSNETLSVEINGETERVTNQAFINYGKANAARGKFGVKTNGVGKEIFFADVMYNGTYCMEDNWEFAVSRTGQQKEKTYTKLVPVEGTVTDKANGTALANAVVRIGLNNIKTNEEGKYSFEGIEVGTHTAAVTKAGYKAILEEIQITDTEKITKDFQLETKEELNLEQYDTIENEDMKVYLGKDFPLVARYEMKKINGEFRGNETDLSQMVINGTAITPVVLSTDKQTSEKTYQLKLVNEEADLDFTMTVKISIKENTLTWEVTNIEKAEGCAKIATINIPGHALLSVDAVEEQSVFAGAQASTTTTVKADTYITFEEGFRPSNRDGYLYAFLSNGTLSAGLFSNSEVEGDKRVIRTNGADNISLSSAVWYYEMGDVNGQKVAANYPDYPKSELPIAKIAIADDVNKDGDIDWNDGALAYRKIMHVAYGSEKVKDQVNSRIAMNFGSMAPNPFLVTADNIKKVYLATDGLPQAVMLKGYGNEGHDSANSEYADIAEREGGVEDFRELIRIAHDYNTEIGIHINAQEIYPEAKSFNRTMLGTNIGNGWNYLDQSHEIDKIWDLATQARWKRLVQLYDRINGTQHYSRTWPEAVEESLGEVAISKEDIKKEAESKPHNMDFIYLDVWYQDSWETRRIAEEINSLGWRFSTEFSAQGEYDSTWQHWSTDAVYGGAGAKGLNSDIIRFIRNDQRDSQVLNYPSYKGTADNPLLGGYRLYGFEGWQGDKSFNNYIFQTFNQNLPTKFLQHYYVTDWTNYGPEEESPVDNTEKEIKLQNDAGDVVVVTRNPQQRPDDNIERTITLNGKVVLEDVKYLLPWKDTEDDTVKLYHWNMEGGESTWQLQPEFASLDNVIVYELSDQGRINKEVIPVTEGAITLKAKEATPYVVVKGEGVKTLVEDFGESDYVADPGFNGYAPGAQLDETEWSGDIQEASVVIEKSLTGDQRLAFNGSDKTVSVETQIKGLKAGTPYVAEIYVQNDSDSKAYIIVDTGREEVENYTEKSILSNYVGCDNKNGTKMQRIQLSFVPEGETARLILMREAGEGSTYMDDIRIVEKTLTNWQEDGSFYQDFETVVQGLYPFVLGSAQGITDAVTHLSQRNKEFTQAGWNGRVIDDVIDGEWSLKHHGANTGIIYQTLPQNFRFEPGKVYTVEFDYQSGPDKAYAMVIGDGELYYVPTENDYLAQARGSENTKHVTMTVTGSGTGQTWIGLYEKSERIPAEDRGKTMGERDFVLDNLRITEDKTAVSVVLDKTTIYLGERANIYGSGLDKITWHSEDESVAKVDTSTNTVEVFKKGEITLTATFEDNTQKQFRIIVKDTKVEEIPRTEYEGITARANTEEPTGEGNDSGRAIHAVDGNPNSIWHSQWQQSSFTVGETTPAVITVDFGKEIFMGGFRFLQRPTGVTAIVSKYKYRVLAQDEQTVLEEGTVELSQAETGVGTWVVREFSDAYNVRYLEISVLAGASNNAAIAEIEPLSVTFLEKEPEEEPEEEITDKVWATGVEDLFYNGKKQTQNIRVYDGTKLLKEKTDYIVTYKNNQNAYTLERNGVDGEYVGKAPEVKITMKGNYKGSKIFNFQIFPKSIEDGVEGVVSDDLYFDSKKGKSKKVTPVVMVDGKKLKAKDFKVTVGANGNDTVDISSPTEEPIEVTIEGQNNYTGTRTIFVTVGESKIDLPLSKTKVNITMNGKAVTKPKVAWKDGGYEFEEDTINVLQGKERLTLNTDFVIKEYEKNDRTGTATLVLEAGPGSPESKYRFHGQKRFTFQIEGTAMSKVLVNIPEADKKAGYPYCGEPIELLEQTGVTVTLADKTTAVDSEAYSVAYTKNENKGTATAILTGKPEKGYMGTKKVTYKIAAAPIAADNITFASGENTTPFMKGGAKPEVEVVVKGITLKEGTDFTVTYGNNKKVTGEAATATAKIKGKGNYSGGGTINFAIEPKAIDSEGITVVAKDKILKKGKWQQSFKVYDADGKALKAGTDYEKEAVFKKLEADGNVSDITAAEIGDIILITVTGKGNYRGRGEEPARISGTYKLLADKYDISKAKVKIADQYYNGHEVTLTETEDIFTTANVNGNPMFIEGVASFEIVEDSYQKNDKKGTAKVTIRGIGEFGGEKVVKFKIKERNIEDKNNWWDGIISRLFNQ